MKNALVLTALALALGGCATTRTPAVVPALEGTPRVPINKTQPQAIPAAPAAPLAAPTNQGE